MTDPNPGSNSYLNRRLSSLYDHSCAASGLNLINLMKLKCHQALLIRQHSDLVFHLDSPQFCYQSVNP